MTPSITKVDETQQQFIVKTDTVFITKEIRVPAEPVMQQSAVKKDIYTPTPQTVIAKENKAPEIKEVEKALRQVVRPITQEPIKETVVVKAKPKKVKPVHLLDIENEDRNAALYNNDPSAKVRSGFALQITTDRLPSNNASAQQPVIRGLLKRKK